MKIIQLIKDWFTEDDFYPEVEETNFYKLPMQLTVEWFRDSGYIVGKIIVNGKEYRTQGKDAEDSVSMVNDCVYTAYGIRRTHKKRMSEIKAYSPSETGWTDLNNGKIPGSVFASRRTTVYRGLGVRSG